MVTMEKKSQFDCLQHYNSRKDSLYQPRKANNIRGQKQNTNLHNQEVAMS